MANFVEGVGQNPSLFAPKNSNHSWLLFDWACITLVAKKITAWVTPSNRDKKKDAAHEPQCSHVEHFCKTRYWNSLVHFSPVTVPVHCRPWDPEDGGVQSVEVGV